MKKILSFIMISVVLFGLFGCDNTTNNNNGKDPATNSGEEETEPTPEAIKLAAPVVTIDENGLATWEAIENAVSYVFKVNDGNEVVTSVRNYRLNEGDSIVVKAKGNGVTFVDSDYSAVVTYTKEAGEEQTPTATKLSAPVVTVNASGVASWAAVANASGYVYKVNDGAETSTSELSVQLTNGDYIVVKAKGDGTDYSDSDYSDEVTYTAQEQPTPVGEREIQVDYDNLVIYVPSERNIRVAQFADLHLSKESAGGYSNNKEERTYAFMRQVVNETDPDLIVLTGDNLYGRSAGNGMTGLENLQRLITVMDELEKPWMFVYGNHDSEELTVGSSKKELHEYLLSCDSPYLIYGNEYSEPNTDDYRDVRYGVYSVKLCDLDSKDLIGAYIALDSGYYDTRISSYNSITEGQINWYKNKVSALQSEFKGTGVIPTVVFNHIQLPEVYNAYVSAYVKDHPSDTAFATKYADGVEASGEYEFVLYQDVREISSDADWVEMIKVGAPTANQTNLYDVMVELGSTKAIFNGHAHNYGFQVKSNGIIFGFATQTGFAPAESINWDPRVGYVYNFDSNFNLVNTTVVNEDESDLLGTGLAVKYMDSANGDDLFLVENADSNGNYVYTVSMLKQWARIKLYCNGELVELSGSNGYTVSGDFSSVYVTNGKLYNESGNPILYFSLTDATDYKITVNPTNKTVNIDMLGDEDETVIPEGAIVADKVNADAGGEAVALWTTAGTSFKEPTSSTVVKDVQESWLGNNWRLFVICDADGKIAYLVLHPAQGYGCPPDTNLYYYHSSYSDYKNNPAIELADGFAPWTSGSGNHNLFSVVIPEGGFAITAHGAGVNSVLDALGVDYSSATTDKELLALVNKPTLLSDSVRLSYDSTKSYVVVTK